MMRLWIILTVSFIISDGALSQCPARLSVMSRVAALRQSDVPYSQQKRELLGYIVQMQRCNTDDDSIFVHVLQRTGAVSYLSGQYNDATLYTGIAIERLKQLTPRYQNIPLLVRMYNYLNIFYDSLHLTANKISAIDSCVYYAVNNGLVNNEIINNMMQRVEYSYNTGDYVRCISDAKIAEDFTARYGEGSDSIFFAEFFFNMNINSLIELNRLDEAETRLMQTISQKNILSRTKQPGLLFNQLARINLREQKFAEALEWMKKSYESNKSYGYALSCKQTLNNIGFCYFHYLDQPSVAHKYYNDALRFNAVMEGQQELNTLENANILGNIANVFVRTESFDSAFVYFDKAFQMIGSNYNENVLLTIPDDEFNKIPNIHYLTSMVRDKGDACFKRYEGTKDVRWLDESINIFRTADKLLTRIKKGQKELLSQLSWRRNTKTVYEHAIRACYEARRPGDAFYFFERSRSVLLNDRIAVNRTTPADRLRKIAMLDMNIQNVSMKADSMDNKNLVSHELRKEIFDLIAEKDRLSGSIKSSGADSGESISAAAFRNTLQPETALLEIFVGDSAVYVMKITGDGEFLVEVDKKRYTELTSAYIGYLTDAGKMNVDFDGFLSVAAGLYKLIFGEAEPDKKIIISPDGGYFPFESLVTKGGHRPEYLIESSAISYTYSAQFLMIMSDVRRGEAPVFFGLAPVRYSSALNLGMLGASDESLHKIATFFDDPLVYTGVSAGRREFFDNFYKYKVVQLYTHASEGVQEGDPIIYFADSAIRLSELMAVDHLATNLIILSACETGKGKWNEGEGVFSFNRSFAELGVPSAMVNLWSVDNQSTYKLNEIFCKYLSEGIASDVALQRAKIDFMNGADKEHRLPYYWAAPVIAGKVITLDVAPRNWDVRYWSVLAVFFVAAFLVIRYAAKSF